jgi:Holliday junction resolvase RusA-like endonuclease
LNGCIYPTKKPDADNIAKIILDALNGVAYTDDTQVINLLVQKRYGEAPEVKVEITEVNNG